METRPLARLPEARHLFTTTARLEAATANVGSFPDYRTPRGLASSATSHGLRDRDPRHRGHAPFLAHGGGVCVDAVLGARNRTEFYEVDPSSALELQEAVCDARSAPARMEVEMKRLRNFAVTFAAIPAATTTAILVTGWGTAVASNIGSVFVTNDASHAVPVTQGDLPGARKRTTDRPRRTPSGSCPPSERRQHRRRNPPTVLPRDRPLSLRSPADTREGAGDHRAARLSDPPPARSRPAPRSRE